MVGLRQTPNFLLRDIFEKSGFFPLTLHWQLMSMVFDSYLDKDMFDWSIRHKRNVASYRQPPNFWLRGFKNLMPTCPQWCLSIGGNLWCKGSCHLRFSGIRPLRGGGTPPFPLRKKTFFFSHWFSVKGGGVPPNSAKEKNLLFRSKNSIFCLFFMHF